MRSELERVTARVAAEVGYIEKASNNRLDEKIANAGSGNYTKYNRDMKAWFPNAKDVFGQGYAYCLIGIYWCMCLAVGTERATELMCGCISGYTPDMAKAFKDAGLFGKEPKPGALIFFADPAKESSARPWGVYHVGFVRKEEGGKVHTTEFNTSSASGVVENGGCVAEKSYDVGYWKIHGYGYPPYDSGGNGEFAGMSDFEHEIWVKSLAADYLIRELSDEEKASNMKYDVMSLLYKLRTSEEGRRNWLKELYYKYLGRAATEDDMQTWLKVMQEGKTRLEIMDKVIRSPEAKRLRGEAAK